MRGWFQRKAAKNAEIAKEVSASRDHENDRFAVSTKKDCGRDEARPLQISVALSIDF